MKQTFTLPTKNFPEGKRSFCFSKAFIILLLFISSAGKTVYSQTSYTFAYTGAMQSFTAPATGSYQLETWGAQGGANWVNNDNFGGYAKAVYNLTAGTVLNIFVGQQPNGITGGYNGGGNGEGVGQGGGGGTDIRSGGSALSNRILVAGGGGGAGYWSSLHIVGGVGGGLTGGDGYRSTTADPGGQGGTQSGSGNGTCVSFNNTAMAGGLGYGGSPSSCGCEGYGGGGGYYGGAGSGNCRGGGGGSGYILPSATNGTFTSGVRTGHGQAVVNVLFSAAVTKTDVACFGQANGSATVSPSGVSGPYTYSWTPGSSTGSVATGLAAGSYTCIIGAPGVTIHPVITIAQPPVLTSSISSQTNITCNGGATGGATLDISGGVAPYTVTWSPTGGNATTVSGLTAGIYIASIHDFNNCSSSSQVTITQGAAFSISGNATNSVICKNNSTTLNGSGASTYTWTGNITNGTSFSPSVTTTYSLTAQNALGCPASNTAVVTVTVNPLPVISVNSGSICAGNSFTLTASGASTYTYSGGNSIVSPTGNTSYSVTGTSTAGCASPSAAVSDVTVVALPLISVNSGSVCDGQSFTIIPSGADTYTFSAGSIVSPTLTTSYSVTGTSLAGCVSSNTAISTVTVEALPVISVNSGSVCSGESFTISPAGAISYTFSSGNAIVTPVTTSSYSITGTNSAGCESTVTNTVTVNAVPTISINSGAICTGQSFTLVGSGAGTYTYEGGNAIVSPTVNSSYTVTGTSPEGCASSNTAIATVSVNPLPVVSVNGVSLICNGISTTLTASGATTYSWNTTATTSTVLVSPSLTTVYNVTGTDANGCNNIASHTLTVNPSPVLAFVNSSSVICSGGSATITVSGADTYSWSSGETTTLIAVSPAITTTYSITGTSANGCMSSAVVTQSVVDCTGLLYVKESAPGLSVYPNPNNGEFIIHSIGKGLLNVVNELGQSVGTIELKGEGSYPVSLNGLANGIYFLNGEIANQLIHQKIILTK